MARSVAARTTDLMLLIQRLDPVTGVHFHGPGTMTVRPLAAPYDGIEEPVFGDWTLTLAPNGVTLDGGENDSLAQRLFADACR